MARPGALAALVVVLSAAPAHADLLGGTLGGVTQVVTGTVGGLLPGGGTSGGGTGGSIIDSTLETVDGVLDDTAVGGLLDGLLGGTTTTPGGGTGGGTTTPTVPGGTTTLPGGVVVPGTTGGSGGGTTTTGDPATGGAVSGIGYTDASGVLADTVGPAITFKVVSKIPRAARTGKLKVRVTSSEAGVVALKALVRSVKPRKGKKLSRMLTETKSAVIAYRAPGTATVKLALPPVAKRDLKKARRARLALQAWGSDVARNQVRRNIKRTLKR